MNFVVQRLPSRIARRRQSADYDVCSRFHGMQQFRRNRFKSPPNPITPDGITHIFCDDETEPNRDHTRRSRDLRIYAHIEHCVRTNYSHTTPNNALIVAATRDSIQMCEHKNLATTKI